MTKYGSRKTEVDGIVFDSKREAIRYTELRMLQRAHKIADLRLQVKFELIPAQYANTGEVYKKGVNKGQQKRKCIEKSVVYIADFVYTDVKTGKTIVEDSKGYRTKDYILKRKMFRWRYGEQYDFREV